MSYLLKIHISFVFSLSGHCTFNWKLLTVSLFAYIFPFIFTDIIKLGCFLFVWTRNLVSLIRNSKLSFPCSKVTLIILFMDLVISHYAIWFFLEIFDTKYIFSVLFKKYMGYSNTYIKTLFIRPDSCMYLKRTLIKSLWQ